MKNKNKNKQTNKQTRRQTQKSVLNMASSESQINKPQCGSPGRAELPDVDRNTGVQSINTERASLRKITIT